MARMRAPRLMRHGRDRPGDLMCPDMEPMRVDRRLIDGQVVDVKVYPSLQEWTEQHPREIKRTIDSKRVLLDCKT